jgi:kynureninase
VSRPTDEDRTEQAARERDAADPLGALREEFHLPVGPGGEPLLYLCGNSLGLQPRGVRRELERELASWAERAVEGHFDGPRPWYRYQERFQPSLGRLVGAAPDEVVVMNTLTVNLHMLMVSFYRPTRQRFRVLVEDFAFPSDAWAVRSQVRFHGFDPDEAVVVARARPGGTTIEEEDIEALLAREGDSIALVLIGGVQYFTGQAFDLGRLAAAAHRAGATFGVDLAHAIGNVELSLHDDDVDFAAWCSYKYLNAGPGAVAGAFVHRRHGGETELPRFAGWWGDDPATRFDAMHERAEFEPYPGASGWQASNPPVLAMAPLGPALELFDRAGLPALRRRSRALTAWAEQLIEPLGGGRLEIITPRDPARRGCQLSLRVRGGTPRALFDGLRAQGVVGDFRPPDVIRVAPAPLYNTFHDVWRLGQALGGALASG